MAVTREVRKKKVAPPKWRIKQDTYQLRELPKPVKNGIARLLRPGGLITGKLKDKLKLGENVQYIEMNAAGRGRMKRHTIVLPCVRRGVVLGKEKPSVATVVTLRIPAKLKGDKLQEVVSNAIRKINDTMYPYGLVGTFASLDGVTKTAMDQMRGRLKFKAEEVVRTPVKTTIRGGHIASISVGNVKGEPVSVDITPRGLNEFGVPYPDITCNFYLPKITEKAIEDQSKRAAEAINESYGKNIVTWRRIYDQLRKAAYGQEIRPVRR